MVIRFIVSGLVPQGDCLKPVCTATQDPIINNCLLDDSYTRAMLYRTWNTGCPPLINDYNITFTYVWSYSGSWYWGSTAELRCMPGYQIPTSKISDVISLLFLYSPIWVFIELQHTV